MAIKEILDRIHDKLGSDDSEVKTLLADAKREASTILDDLRSANNESKSRKDKIREMQDEIETLKQDFAKASNPALKQELDELRKVKAEYDKQKQQQETDLRSQWAEMAKRFEVGETDKRKVKLDELRNDFAWASDDNPLSLQDIQNNMRLFSVADKAGVFAEPTPAPKAGEPPTSTPPPAPVHNTSGAAIAAKLYKN